MEKAKMTYYASFKLNSIYFTPIQDNNKKRIISDIKEIARGNRPSGKTISWLVWTKAETGRRDYVAGGVIDANGNSHNMTSRQLGEFE